MNQNDVLKAINAHIAQHSNFDAHRDYLGLSKISGCPRKVYDEYRDGIQPTEQIHRMSFAGYEHEFSILSILRQQGIALSAGGMEIIVPFDSRLRGHLDAVTIDGESIIECKSLTVRKFERIQQEGKPFGDHYVQVQLYMRYGGYKGAFIVYRCRETYQHIVLYVPYNEQKAKAFEDKAKDILKAIDDGIRPVCTCGSCGDK